MRTVSVSELKAKLSAYLARVRAGEELTVTDRGRAVAQLSPLSRGRPQPSRQRLIDAGILRPGRGRWSRELLKPPPGPSEGAGVLQGLIEERREDR